MGEIILKGYQCERCAHKWVPRKIEKKKHDLSFKDKKNLKYTFEIIYYLFNCPSLLRNLYHNNRRL